MAELANSLDTESGRLHTLPLIDVLSFISQIIRSVIIFGLRKALFEVREINFTEGVP
jgi:hypothetical protein